MLIPCVDDMKRFPEAIADISQKQKRRPLSPTNFGTFRYIAKKDKKPFMTDLKSIYQTITKEQGYENLITLDEKWGKKYPI